MDQKQLFETEKLIAESSDKVVSLTNYRIVYDTQSFGKLGRIEIPASGIVKIPKLRFKDSSIQYVELFSQVGAEKKTPIHLLQIELLNEVDGNALRTVYFLLPPHYVQTRLEPQERNVKLNCEYLKIRGINKTLIPGENLFLVIDPAVPVQKVS